MQRCAYVFLISFAVVCCQSGEKNTQTLRNKTDSIPTVGSITKPYDSCDALTCSLDSFIQESQNFLPRNTSFNRNINELLKCIDVCCIINKLSASETDIFIEAVDVIVLRQHLIWLKNNNQGYDIYAMHEPQGKCMIDFYLKNLNVVIKGDPFVNSGFRPQQYLGNKKRVKNETIRQLLIEIDAEQTRPRGWH